MEPFRRILLASPPELLTKTSASFMNRLFGGTEHVLSRRLCTFRYHRLQSDKVSREQLRALAFDAELSSPAEQTGVHITISGPHVNIWTWDGSLFGLAPPTTNLNAVPETLLHTPIDGFTLRECLEGVEAQYWADGVLMASRWWPQPPEEVDWLRFCRSSGAVLTDDGAAMPPVQPGVVWSNRAARNRAPVTQLSKHAAWTDMAKVALAVIALPLTYYGVENIAISLETRKYQQLQAVLQDTTGEQRAIGRQISALQSELGPFERGLRTNNPVSALASILSLLHESSAELRRFSLQDGVLELAFAATGSISEPELVQQLESIDRVSDVRLETQSRSNSWLLRAVLLEASDE